MPQYHSGGSGIEKHGLVHVSVYNIGLYAYLYTRSTGTYISILAVSIASFSLVTDLYL